MLLVIGDDNLIDKSITLELQNNGVQKSVHCMSGESGSRRLLVTLTNNGDVVDVTNKIFYLLVKNETTDEVFKADNDTITFDGDDINDNHTICVKLPTMNEGKYILEIVITDTDDNILFSPMIVVDVEKSLRVDGAEPEYNIGTKYIIADEDYNNLKELVRESEGLVRESEELVRESRNIVVSCETVVANAEASARASAESSENSAEASAIAMSKATECANSMAEMVAFFDNDKDYLNAMMTARFLYVNRRVTPIHYPESGMSMEALVDEILETYVPDGTVTHYIVCPPYSGETGSLIAIYTENNEAVVGRYSGQSLFQFLLERAYPSVTEIGDISTAIAEIRTIINGGT